jgi:hypothetical protein
MQLTGRDKLSRNIIRLFVYTALGALLWVKLKSGRAVQIRVVVPLVAVAILVLNYYCVRLLADRSKLMKAAGAMLAARSAGSYALVVGIAGVLICDVQSLVCAIGSIHQDCPPSSFGVVWLASFLGMLFVWVGAYEIRISGDTFEYLSFVGGYRSFNNCDIDHARIRRGWFTYSDRFRPTNRLEIFLRGSQKSKPVVVNLKAFQDADLKIVFAWLGTKLRQECVVAAKTPHEK